jgi:hypothetical protein
LCDQVRDSFIFFLNTYQSGKFQYSNRFWRTFQSKIYKTVKLK